MNLVRIRVAGFGLDIEAFDRREKYNILKVWEKFLSDDKPEVSVKVSTHDFLPDPLGHSDRRSFALGANWSLYRSRNNYCLELKNIEKNNSYITNLAVFNPDFLSFASYVNLGLSRNQASCLSYPIDQIFFIHLLSLYGGLLVHGCGFNYQGEGFLLLGSSGAGKSTLGRIFLEHRAVSILNDDKMIIRKQGNSFFLYGTPWHGSLSFYSAGWVGLKKVFFLKKAPANAITKLGVSEAAFRLAALSFMPYADKKLTLAALATTIALAQDVAFFELAFVPDKTILDFIDYECF